MDNVNKEECMELGVYYDEVSHLLWFKVAADYERNTTDGYNAK